MFLYLYSVNVKSLAPGTVCLHTLTHELVQSPSMRKSWLLSNWEYSSQAREPVLSGADIEQVLKYLLNELMKHNSLLSLLRNISML